MKAPISDRALGLTENQSAADHVADAIVRLRSEQAEAATRRVQPTERPHEGERQEDARREIRLPPEVSDCWTAHERLAVISWITRITLDRIQRDDPEMPFVAKEPMRELFRAIQFVATESPSVLEDYRAILLKPYDPSRDHHGVLAPSEVLDAMRKANE